MSDYRWRILKGSTLFAMIALVAAGVAYVARDPFWLIGCFAFMWLAILVNVSRRWRIFFGSATPEDCLILSKSHLFGQINSVLPDGTVVRALLSDPPPHLVAVGTGVYQATLEVEVGREHQKKSEIIFVVGEYRLKDPVVVVRPKDKRWNLLCDEIFDSRDAAEDFMNQVIAT